MTTPPEPYVDRHALTIAAPRDAVWAALDRSLTATLLRSERDLVRRLLGTDPPAGFAIGERVEGERLALRGRHRFSRYTLVFTLADAPGGGTELAALTYAAFPGPHGRVYRLLVITSRAHVVATTHLLRGIRRRAEREAHPFHATGPNG